LLSRVEHDEIVAQPVHFPETRHGPVYRRQDSLGPVAD
jgi:hypothetical protein